MNENCLVTQLKSVVNNPNLIKMDYVRLYFSKSPNNVTRNFEITQLDSSKTLYLKASGNVINNGGQLVDHVEYTSTYARTVTIDNSDCYVDVGPMYNIKSFRLLIPEFIPYLTFDAKRVFMYGPFETLSYQGKGEGEIICLYPNNVVVLGCYRAGYDLNHFYTDIEQFKNNTVITTLSLSSNQTYGNIEDLAKCVSLASLLVPNSLVTGEVNTLASSLAGNGKTTTLKITGPLPNCTDDGNAITEEYLASKSATNKRIVLTFSGGSYSKTYE